MSLQVRKETASTFMLELLPSNDALDLHSAMVATFQEEGRARGCIEGNEFIAEFLNSQDVITRIANYWNAFEQIISSPSEGSLYLKEAIIMRAAFHSILQELKTAKTFPEKRTLKIPEANLYMRADISDKFFRKCVPIVSIE